MAFSLCSSIVANTGFIACDAAPGIPSKMFIWNGSYAISGYSESAFQTALETASKKAKADPDKLFPFPVIQDIADNSEANTEGTLNLGFKTIIKEGLPAYTFKVFAGQTLAAALRKFNNQTVRILILDRNNKVWGAKSGANYVGMQVRLFTTGLKFADGQNVTEGVVDVTVSFLDATEVNDNATFGEIANSAGIVGLSDATPTEYAAHASNVHKLKVGVATSEMNQTVDLYDYFADELEDDALYTAFTGATYATPLAITSVAKNVSNKGWDITFDSSAYTALATPTTIKIVYAVPPTLAAAGITEVEILPIIVTK